MRDFRRDMDAAAFWSGSCPAGELSWSLLRGGLFESCRRAYFFLAFMSQGGWDEHAEPEIRECYLLRRSLSLEEWTDSILAACMERAFSVALLKSGPKARLEAAKGAMLSTMPRLLAEGEAQLRSEAWRSDPKSLCLVGGSASGMNSSSATSAARGMASAAISSFLSSEELRLALEAGPMDFKPFRKFESFRIPGFDVWLSPPPAFVSKGSASFLSLLRAEPPDSDARMQASLLALFSAERLFCKDASLTLSFPGADGLLRSVALKESPSLARKEAERSMASMLKLVRPDGSVSIDDFEMSGYPSKCGECRFQTLCLKLENTKGHGS